MPLPVDRFDLDARSIESGQELAGPRRGRVAADPSKIRRSKVRHLTILIIGNADHYACLAALLQRVEHRRRGRADQPKIINCDVDCELGAANKPGEPPRHLLRLWLLLIRIGCDQEQTLDRSLLPLLECVCHDRLLRPTNAEEGNSPRPSLHQDDGMVNVSCLRSCAPRRNLSSNLQIPPSFPLRSR
jgi:hypothetical protein